MKLNNNKIFPKCLTCKPPDVPCQCKKECDKQSKSERLGNSEEFKNKKVIKWADIVKIAEISIVYAKG